MNAALDTLLKVANCVAQIRAGASLAQPEMKMLWQIFYPMFDRLIE